MDAMLPNTHAAQCELFKCAFAIEESKETTLASINGTLAPHFAPHFLAIERNFPNAGLTKSADTPSAAEIVVFDFVISARQKRAQGLLEQLSKVQ